MLNDNFKNHQPHQHMTLNEQLIFLYIFGLYVRFIVLMLFDPKPLVCCSEAGEFEFSINCF